MPISQIDASAVSATNPTAVVTDSSGNITLSSTSRVAARTFSNGMWTEYFYQEPFSPSQATQTQTWTWTCPSYAHFEVIFVANQTNGGTYNNFYLRGIWSNNYVSHKWDVLESIGSLTGATFTFVVADASGVVDGSGQNGRLRITMSYAGGFGSVNPPKILIRALYSNFSTYAFTTA
jgi:hypothetical protein